MRPCECEDAVYAAKLNEQGIKMNDDSLCISPNYVTLTMGHTSINISMSRFEQFARWFLENQEGTEDKAEEDTSTFG